MRFSSFKGYAPTPPFTVLDSNGKPVYSNSIFKAVFGENREIPRKSFTFCGHRYTCIETGVTLSGSEYTVCAVYDGSAEEYPIASLDERFTSFLGLIAGVSDGGRIRKRPCGMRYLLSLWTLLLDEELDEDMDIEALDGMSTGVYCSLNAQGLLIALSCLYRMTRDAELSVAVSDEVVLIRVKGSARADGGAFMRDFLCELAHASGFELELCDGGATVTLKRFSAKTFTAFSPTKEYAKEATQLALLGLM